MAVHPCPYDLHAQRILVLDGFVCQNLISSVEVGVIQTVMRLSHFKVWYVNVNAIAREHNRKLGSLLIRE